MRLLHSRNSWHYSQGFQIDIDFCIWVLTADGLHVPPFDQHEDGDGSLHSLGFTAADWREWMARVMQRYHEGQAQLQQKQGSTPHERLRRLAELHDPLRAWSGNAAIGERLAELYKKYINLSSERKHGERLLEGRLRAAEKKRGTRLFDELLPFSKHLPPLIIHYVYYQQELIYLFQPASIIISITDDTPDAEAFRSRLLSAAAELAARNGRRRSGPSAYISIPEFPSQCFQTYASPGAQAPVAQAEKTQRVRLFTSTDPLQQIALDWLYDETNFHLGEIDPATVRFRRSKSLPGWQLYLLTCAETDGEQHSMMIILKQKEDGSWQLFQGATYTSFSDIPRQFIFPVRDHPFLILSGGEGHTNAPGQPARYSFEAYGEVVDNGFDVTRVVLLNAAGLRFEDVVQDSLVFFLSSDQLERQNPTHAELYNRAGEIVWRQEILGQGWPFWLNPPGPSF
ncbi:MAG TPA: hypothetical protein VFN35_29520 [Ktedonobacteraceae bacterium]|nr:hypothetical protein [Ktedonobacteraceae bacterium]